MLTSMYVRISAVLVLSASVLGMDAAVAQVGAPSSSPSPVAPGAAAQTPTKGQEYCPITTEERIDPEIFTDYKGTRVYFCCERCKKKFEREPEKYTANLAAFQAPQGDSSTPARGTGGESQGQSNQGGHVHDHAGQQRGDEPGVAAPPQPTDSEPADTHDHDHSHGGGNGTAGGHTARFLKWLGNFHPPMTNFPVGVLVATAVAEILFILRKAPLFDHAARFGVAVAALMGIVAAALGWCFGGFRLVDSDPLLLTHRWLGTAAAVWMLVLFWASERVHRPLESAASSIGLPHIARSRGLYRVLLFAGAALVTVTGFFGGAMVYGLNHYGW